MDLPPSLSDALATDEWCNGTGKDFGAGVSAPLPLDLNGLSRRALKLHVCAVLVTLDNARAGFIPDRYLLGLPDAALNLYELCAARAWTRVARGYQVREDEVLRIATIVRDPVSGSSAVSR